MPQTEILSHPTLGKLPARQVLECIFALSPEGTFLHHHREEVRVSPLPDGGAFYELNGQTPAPGRERCCVIPPFVREFGTV